MCGDVHLSVGSSDAVGILPSMTPLVTDLRSIRHMWAVEQPPAYPLLLRGFALRMSKKLLNQADKDAGTVRVERLFNALIEPCSGCRELMLYFGNRFHVCLFDLHDAAVSPARKRACRSQCSSCQPGNTDEIKQWPKGIIGELDWPVAAAVLGIDPEDYDHSDAYGLDNYADMDGPFEYEESEEEDDNEFLHEEEEEEDGAQA